MEVACAPDLVVEVGLGLAIAREAVHVLGGALEIESLPASGTTARVVLPPRHET